MTRSFDRRDWTTPTTAGGSWCRVSPEGIYEYMTPAYYAKRKEDDLSLDLDCMCSKNDPDCSECWAAEDDLPSDAAVGKAAGSFVKMRNPYKPVRVEPFLDQFDRDVRYRFDEVPRTPVAQA